VITKENYSAHPLPRDSDKRFKLKDRFHGMPLFWRIQLVAWPAFALLTLPIKFGIFGSWHYALFATFYREPLGLLLTLGLRAVYHRHAVGSMRPARLGATVLSLAMLAGAFDTLTFWWIFDHTLQIESEQGIGGLFCFRSLIYCVWSFLYFWIKDQIDARARQIDLIRAETAARDAEILMLRAQVAPHFLFNAFNAIQADLESRPASLVPVVQGLSDYFRYSLTNRQETYVPLGGEFDAMRNYLTVEKARFRDSLLVECHMDASVRDLLVPGIFLQPLVENALKFGHQTSPTPLRISLRVTRTTAGGARIEVTNSGSWVNPPAAPPAQEMGGCGLSNLRQRLSLLYQGRAQFKIPASADDGMVRAELIFPAPN
jgi:two-component system, LytTR family, sensor kinase